MNQPLFTLTAESETNNYGKVIIEPLEQGYGHTIGNSIRRVLLMSMPGAALTSVKIEGVKHQFSTLEGLREDMVEFVLNLKQVRLKIETENEVTLRLTKKGPGKIMAGDIDAPAGVTIVNPDLELGTLADKKNEMNATMTAKRGYGYVPFEENPTTEFGAIPLDASYSPVERVNYRIEATRVGRMTNLDRLVLEVWTDGTILPTDAVRQASEVLVGYFAQIVNPQQPIIRSQDTPKETQSNEEVLKTRIEELDIPTRIVNALAKAKIETIGQIVSTPKAELMKIKNLGAKSLGIVQEQLIEKGVSLMES